jgi:hypothetical protein
MNTKQRKTTQPPVLVVGRRGGISVLDAIVRGLWNGDAARECDSDWPTKRLVDIRDSVAKALGYDIAESTVRSAIYNHPELFEKSKDGGPGVRYRLSASFRRTLE